MMNRVTLIGRLAADPELREIADNKVVCTFRLAVKRPYKDENGENITDWIPVTVWGKLAENCHTFLSKGRKVGVDGSLYTSSYEDSAGIKRSAFEINANMVEFLGTKGNRDASENNV